MYGFLLIIDYDVDMTLFTTVNLELKINFLRNLAEVFLVVWEKFEFSLSNKEICTCNNDSVSCLLQACIPSW